jgi:hypothetical protein
MDDRTKTEPTRSFMANSFSLLFYPGEYINTLPPILQLQLQSDSIHIPCGFPNIHASVFSTPDLFRAGPLSPLLAEIFGFTNNRP